MIHERDGRTDTECISKADYVMDGSVLQSVSEEKDLGVTIHRAVKMIKTRLYSIH